MELFRQMNCITSDLCVRTPLTTPRIFSVISFSCCKTLNLRGDTNQSLSHVTRTKNEHKIPPVYTNAFYQKENLHVHLVRSRFVLFLWEAAQYNGSNGPLQKTERFHSKNSLYFYFSSTVSHKNSPLTIDCIWQQPWLLSEAEWTGPDPHVWHQAALCSHTGARSVTYLRLEWLNWWGEK